MYNIRHPLYHVSGSRRRRRATIFRGCFSQIYVTSLEWHTCAIVAGKIGGRADLETM